MAGEDIYAGSSTAPLLSEAYAFRPLAQIPGQILSHERMARMMALKEAEFEAEQARLARAEDRLLQDRLLKRRGGEAQGVGGGSGRRRSGGAGGAGAGADAELSALIGAQVDPALRGSELALSGALAAQSRADQEMAAADIDAARNPEWIRGRSAQQFLEGLSGQPDAGRAHLVEFGPPKPPKPTRSVAREAGERPFDPTASIVLGDKGLANPWTELGHGKEYVGNTGYAEELEAQGAAPEGFARRVEAYNSRLGLAEGREQARFATEYAQEAARISEERRAARQERYVGALSQTTWGKRKTRDQLSAMADLLSRPETSQSALDLLGDEAANFRTIIQSDAERRRETRLRDAERAHLAETERAAMEQYGKDIRAATEYYDQAMRALRQEFGEGKPIPPDRLRAIEDEEDRLVDEATNRRDQAISRGRLQAADQASRTRASTAETPGGPAEKADIQWADQALKQAKADLDMAESTAGAERFDELSVRYIERQTRANPDNAAAVRDYVAAMGRDIDQLRVALRSEVSPTRGGFGFGGGSWIDRIPGGTEATEEDPEVARYVEKMNLKRELGPLGNWTGNYTHPDLDDPITPAEIRQELADKKER